MEMKCPLQRNLFPKLRESVWQRTFAGAQTWQSQMDVGNDPQALEAETHNKESQRGLTLAYKNAHVSAPGLRRWN